MRTAVVSASETSVVVAAALKLGAAGYIPKTSTPHVIVAALRVIVAGGIYIPPQVLAEIAHAPMFTARQLEVLQLIAQGASNREIARALGIADNTAKQHTHAVFQALNVTSRSQAIVMAARLGIDLS
jgi:DNA-binding NarL/FixJ family response regulator